MLNAFLYTNNERSERKIRETIPFYHCIKKKKKYPGINLPNEAEDLYFENSKTLLKEIDDTNTWKDVPGLED